MADVEKIVRKIEAPQARGFTVLASATYLGIGRVSVYNLINTGKLPAYKLGGRTILLREDLDRLLDSLPRFKGREAAQ